LVVVGAVLAVQLALQRTVGARELGPTLAMPLEPVVEELRLPVAGGRARQKAVVVLGGRRLAELDASREPPAGRARRLEAERVELVLVQTVQRPVFAQFALAAPMALVGTVGCIRRAEFGDEEDLVSSLVGARTRMCFVNY
jgi:hypothetical protein